MQKFTEMITSSVEIAKTVTTGISSTNLLDMRNYKKLVANVVALKPLDATGSVLNLTVTLYESTASTWNGAVATALTNFVGTAAVYSGSNGVVRVELNDYDMSINNSKRYIGLKTTCWTATDQVAIVERYRADNEPVE